MWWWSVWQWDLVADDIVGIQTVCAQCTIASGSYYVLSVFLKIWIGGIPRNIQQISPSNAD